MALTPIQRKMILDRRDKGLLEVKPRTPEEAEEIKQLKEQRRTK